MMLAKIFGYVLSLLKITYRQKSVRISQTFFAVGYIHKFNVPMKNVNCLSALPMLSRYV